MTSHDMAIGAAKESARNHMTTIITLATRFEVWALEQIYAFITEIKHRFYSYINRNLLCEQNLLEAQRTNIGIVGAR